MNVFKNDGFICWVFKNPIFDTWNGYLSIPSFHPWYEKHCDDLVGVEVHGGLTFSNFIDNWGEWVLGFDTNHFGDSYGPNAEFNTETISFSTGLYKDKEYVLEEIRNLIKQAHEDCSKEVSDKIRETVDHRITKAVLSIG